MIAENAASVTAVKPAAHGAVSIIFLQLKCMLLYS